MSEPSTTSSAAQGGAARAWPKWFLLPAILIGCLVVGMVVLTFSNRFLTEIFALCFPILLVAYEIVRWPRLKLCTYVVGLLLVFSCMFPFDIAVRNHTGFSIRVIRVVNVGSALERIRSLRRQGLRDNEDFIVYYYGCTGPDLVSTRWALLVTIPPILRLNTPLLSTPPGIYKPNSNS